MRLIESSIIRTSDPLNAGGVWTSDWDKSNLSNVGIMVIADQNARIDLQFSGNQFGQQGEGDVDSTYPTAGYQLNAGIPVVRRFEKLGRAILIVTGKL